MDISLSQLNLFVSLHVLWATQLGSQHETGTDTAQFQPNVVSLCGSKCYFHSYKYLYSVKEERVLDCTNLVFVVSAAAAAAPPPSAGAAADVAAAVEAGGGAGEGEVGSAAAPPISTSGGCAVDMAFFRTRQNTLKYNRTLGHRCRV